MELRRQVTKLKNSAHNIEIKRTRNITKQKEYRLCKFGERNYNKEQVENEFHFLLKCPNLDCISFDRKNNNFDFLDRWL